MSLSTISVGCDYCGKIVCKKALTTHYNTQYCTYIRNKTGRFKDHTEELCFIIKTLRESGKDFEYFFENCLNRDIDCFSVEGVKIISDAVKQYIEA